MTYFDFNNAGEQTSFDLIPKGTVLKLRATIKPGGYNDASQGWTGGYATLNDNTGSVYLSCEFVVMESSDADNKWARRKMWSLIGLHSPKGPEWGSMGRTFIKAMLNSARGILPSDNSPAAQNARRIAGFADLDGLEFIGKIDWEKDQNGEDKNVIKAAITPEHKDYAPLMGYVFPSAVGTQSPAANASNTFAQTSVRAPTPARPSWAQ